MSDNELEYSITTTTADSKQQVDELIAKLEKLDKQYGKLNRTGKSREIEKLFDKIPDPVKEANKQLDLIDKKISKLRSKQIAEPEKSRHYEREIQKAERQRQDLYRGISKSSAVKGGIESANEAYNAEAIQASYKMDAIQKQITKENEAQLKLKRETLELEKRAEEATEQEVARQKEIEDSLTKAELALDPYKQKMYELTQQIEEQRQAYKEAYGDQSAMNEAINKIRDLKQQQEALKESTKQTTSWWEKLIGRIKNIAVYRTIRTIMKEVVKFIQQGFSNLINLSDEASQLSDGLKQDYNLLATAFGSIFLTVLQPLMPIIDTLTDMFLDLANGLNKFIAQLMGSDHYLKVVRKDIDNVKKGVGLLSFDKFESLTKKKDENTEGVDLVEEQLESTKSSLMGGISSIVTSLIGPLKDLINDLFKFLGYLAEALQPISDIMGEIYNWLGGVITAIRGLLKIFTGDVDDAFELIKDGFKKMLQAGINVIVGIVNLLMNAVIGLINACIKAVNFLLKPFDAIAHLFGAKAGTVAIPTIPKFAMPKVALAEGGFTTANFIATNENNRREWVGRNANATAVVNDTQMSDIMFQAVRKGAEEGVVNAVYNTGLLDVAQQRIVIDGNNINDSAFVRAIYPAFRAEVQRRGGIPTKYGTVFLP